MPRFTIPDLTLIVPVYPADDPENITRGDYDKPPVSMTMAGVIVFVMCIVVSIMMFVMKIMTHVPGTKW